MTGPLGLAKRRGSGASGSPTVPCRRPVRRHRRSRTGRPFIASSTYGRRRS